MEDYTKQEVRDMMYLQLMSLMKEAHIHIDKKDEEAKNFYNRHAHWYLEDNVYELMFPLDEKKWPSSFKNQYLEMDDMHWPQYTNYCYLMDVVAPPCIPFSLLHFGYAVVDNKLIRTTFFVVQSMVSYQLAPQGMVIDPLAHYHGIKPSYYIGSYVPDKKYIEEWMSTRKNPLELYMVDVEKEKERQHKERIRDSYFQSYFIQMAHEPHWFPSELIKFAKEENLHIPPQGWQ